MLFHGARGQGKSGKVRESQKKSGKNFGQGKVRERQGFYEKGMINSKWSGKSKKRKNLTNNFTFTFFHL